MMIMTEPYYYLIGNMLDISFATHALASHLFYRVEIEIRAKCGIVSTFSLQPNQCPASQYRTQVDVQ